MPDQLGMFEPKTVVDPATGKARRVEHPVDPPPSRRDPDLGRLLRDDAIVAVAAHTRADWIALARQAVRELCAAGRPFTSDDVWDTIDRRAGGRADPPEPRALGAVMRWADRQGLAVPTDRTSPSQRPDCHRRPVRIWQPTR